MKNKKSMLTLGILALVLILGVGYAVVSSVSLSISGKASVGNSDLKVSFNGETTPSSEKVTASATDGAMTATIDVKNLELEETVYAEYTIQNKETDIDADVIKDSIENDKSEFFEVTTDVDDTAKTIGKNSTAVVRVSVKLIKTPVDSADSTANITVNLKAEPKK